MQDRGQHGWLGTLSTVGSAEMLHEALGDSAFIRWNVTERNPPGVG